MNYYNNASVVQILCTYEYMFVNIKDSIIP